MFQLISPDELVPGKKYMIDLNCCLDGVRTVVKLNEDFYPITYRHKGVFHYKFNGIQLQFGKLYNVTTDTKVTNTWAFDPSVKVYTFVSQNPQWQMERRSVNLIVRRLLGDDCFEW
jgi:hypothetical protein